MARLFVGYFLHAGCNIWVCMKSWVFIIELLEESAYNKTELLAYDKCWDSISIER